MLQVKKIDKGRLKQFWLEEESGAIVIEASISLTVLMFVMMSFYSYVNIVTAEAKIRNSMMIAAKDISQYYYIYYQSGIGEVAYNHSKTMKQYRKTGEDFTTAFKEFGSLNSIAALGSAYGEITELASKPGRSLHALVGSQVFSGAESLFMEWAVNSTFNKNLSANGLSGDDFLNAHKVYAFDLGTTKVDKNNLELQATYKVKIYDFFGIPFDLTLQSNATTHPWRGR